MKILPKTSRIALASLFVAACSSSGFIRGDVTDNKYTSPSKSFTCTIPSDYKGLEITDGSDSNGESVRFQHPYAHIWRIEYFKINGHPSTHIDTSKSTIEQLHQFKNNVMTLYSANLLMEQLHDKELVLGDRTGYLAIMRYKSPPPDTGNEERAFLFFRANNHLAVMQYGHWNLHDLNQIENEVTRFYKLCSF